MLLTYCVRCVLPNSKPDLHFDADGVCAACRAYESGSVRSLMLRNQNKLP